MRRFSLMPLPMFLFLFAFTAAAAFATPLADIRTTIAKDKIEVAPATAPAAARDVQITVPLPDRKYASVGQGPCGQFAMGIVLGHLGYTVDMDKIFRESNPGGGSFTSPSNVQRYMLSQGVASDIRNKCELKDIVAEVDAGRVPMAMISTTGTAHWIAITGYKTDASGKVTAIRMSDSCYGNTGPYEMPIADFERQWNQPLKNYSVLDPMIGYDRLLVTYGAKDSHDPTLLDKFGSFDTAMNDALFGGANSAVNGWNRKDPLQIVGGGVQAIGGLAIKGTFGCPGELLSSGGDALETKGQEMRGQGGLTGVAGTVVQGAGIVVDGAGKLVTGAGNLVATGWNGFTNGVKGLFGGW